MELEITPEPTPPEREALLRGLERLLAAGREPPLPAPYRSGWRDAGVREATAVDYATARPRSTRGANLA